ncbi:hypothetical protein, partial [Pseudomonas putida]|uniref:hypothetical protein n=1 Tax=Pseudomonas putida TaxID=303 RepID=UPI003D680EEA
TTMTNLFRPQGAFGWFSYTTSRDTITMPVKISPTRPKVVISRSGLVSRKGCKAAQVIHTSAPNTGCTTAALLNT